MPRPSNTAERRAQITEAFIKVMARRGYDGASIAEIAKAASLTSGLVHYHFKSKQEILLTALQEIVARHNRNLETRLGSAAGDPITEIEVFIDFHLGLGADSDSEALACWILLSDEALRDREIRVELHEALAAMAARLEDTIQRGIEQKAFACQAVGAAASGLMAVIQGYFVLAATARTTIPKGSAARSTRQMAEGLLRPARPFSASKGKP